MCHLMAVSRLKVTLHFIWVLVETYVLLPVLHSQIYDEWNRHRESEIHNIQEIGSGMKLYYLWVKGYSTWGERDTIFLCWPQTTCGTPSANYWSGLSGPRKSNFPFGCQNSTHCFFSNPQSPQPMLPVHDVIHTPWSHFLSGVLFWHLWMTHPPCVHVNTCTHVST